MEKNIKIAILYSYYGKLLNEKQRLVIEQYYLEDLSLTEIADLEGVSKQAISNMIKRSEKKLEDYEKNLKLVKKLEEIQGSLEILDKYLASNLDQEVYRPAQDSILEIIKKIN